MPRQAGVWPGIKGTIVLMLLVVLLAFPLGIACAVYLEEYAGNRVRPLDASERAQPRRGAVGGLRPARPGDLRQGAQRVRRAGRRPAGQRTSSCSLDRQRARLAVGQQRPQPRRRWARPLGARAADRDHHHDGGATSRAPVDPGGCPRGRRRNGRRSVTTCCPAASPGILTGTVLALARAPAKQRRSSSSVQSRGP